MEEVFPTQLELAAASALLLLSTNVFVLSKSTTTTSSYELEVNDVMELETELCKKNDDLELISLEKSVDTTSCPSSLTIDDYCVHLQRTDFIAVTRSCELKLKVARRARTKVIYRSLDDREPASKTWSKLPPKTPKTVSTSLVGGTTITESSCLSSGGSNEISSSRKGRKKVGSLTKTTVTEKKRRRRGTGISHLSRKAEGIRKLLSSQGSFSEVRIRQLLGDSPDTSKALRMLLRKEEVKRSGVGGRLDPFIYTIAADSNSMVC
ncbi:unnamed protein product [Amaranthus hypochondriacus]